MTSQDRTSNTARDTETREGPVDYHKEAEKLAAADYQARMEHFRRKASKPLWSYGGRPHGGPLNEEAGSAPERWGPGQFG